MVARVGAGLSCRNGEYYTGGLCKNLLFLFDDFGIKPIAFTGLTFGRMKEFGLQKFLPVVRRLDKVAGTVRRHSAFLEAYARDLENEPHLASLLVWI